MNVKLVKLPQRFIVASHKFESVSNANVNSMGSIVGPFDQALGKTLIRCRCLGAAQWRKGGAPTGGVRTS